MNDPMLILGLTGSIGMGKTSVAAHLAKNNIPVLDADAEVHKLYGGAAAPLIEAAFPGTTINGVVDRKKLSAALMAQSEKIETLQKIVHPLVREVERDFLLTQASKGVSIAVLEIPLLFETGGDRLVDVTLVVSAPEEVQKARVLLRPGMSEEKFVSLLANQMPDAEKRACADFVVDTSLVPEETFAQVDKIINSLDGRKGAVLEQWQRGFGV